MPKAAAAKISNVAPANVTIGTDSPAVILGAEPVAKTLVKALPATKKPVPVATLVAAVKPVETPAPKTVIVCGMRSRPRIVSLSRTRGWLKSTSAGR